MPTLLLVKTHPPKLPSVGPSVLVPVNFCTSFALLRRIEALNFEKELVRFRGCLPFYQSTEIMFDWKGSFPANTVGGPSINDPMQQGEEGQTFVMTCEY